MKTLILPPKFSEESNRIRKAALAEGWQVERLPSWRIPDHLHGVPVAIYGEPLFVAHVEEVLGVKFPAPPEDWLLHLPAELVHRKIMAMPLSEARLLEDRWFIKPADYKTFKAGVFPNGAALPSEEEAPGKDLTLISEVVHWESEFRFFMRAGKAVAGSVYFRNGETAEVEGSWPSTAEEFQHAKDIAEQAFAATVDRLPETVVIDTGYIRGKGWAVIEANPAWGSGLYGADPNLVLEVLG